jgi:hypothetical protein
VRTRALTALEPRAYGQHGDFRLIDGTVEVYGLLLGQAWERYMPLCRAGWCEPSVATTPGAFSLVTMTVLSCRRSQLATWARG